MTVKKNRIQMPVDPEFNRKMKELQKKLELATGKDISIRELTAELSKNGVIDDIEKKMINNNDITFKIRFDRRML